MTKKTAVEVIDEMLDFLITHGADLNEHKDDLANKVKQALLMEREQMGETYGAGIDEGAYRAAMDLHNDEYIAKTFDDFFNQNYRDGNKIVSGVVGKKTFYIDEVRPIINSFNRGEITIGRFVEWLNGDTAKNPNVFSPPDCPFHYCPHKDLCSIDNKCINSSK
jgi:hypothetical protein